MGPSLFVVYTNNIGQFAVCKIIKSADNIEIYCVINSQAPLSTANRQSRMVAYVAYAANQQVAQLWQRDSAKLNTFSINVQRYSQNHAQNRIFGPHYGATGAI